MAAIRQRAHPPRQAPTRAVADDAPVGIAQRTAASACRHRGGAATMLARTSAHDMTHPAPHRSSIAPRDAGGAAWSDSGNAHIASARVVGTGLFMRLNAAH
ncbi:MAG: hypothetical protein ABI887_11890 [Burkholderiales bacterium]